MTGFSIFYGFLYFFFWLWLYKKFALDWSWWGATLIGLFGVVALHLALALFGHISMLHYQSKKRRRLEKERSASEQKDD